MAPDQLGTECIPEREPVVGGPGQAVKFDHDSGFQRDVRQRVDEYFRRTGHRKRDSPQMYLKTAIIFAWLIGSYVLLVFFSLAWWQVVPLVVALGLAMGGIAFNVQHDGNHHAYSRYEWINRLMARSLDFVGASSYLWHWKHNVLHHTYVNISGQDTDIDVGPLARFTPHQKRLPAHRWQHLYMWALYGFMTIRWQFYRDFNELITSKIEGHKFPRPKGWDLATFFVGKLVFATLALAIPMLFHPIWLVLLVYFGVSFVLGVVMAVVFQLAHCTEQASFPLPQQDTGRMDNSWAIHQVSTTVDFARKSRVASWLLGGLNFQIEHHLFPQICHVNYPGISKIVEETCRDHGVEYKEHASVWAGLAAHFHWLRLMGSPANT